MKSKLYAVGILATLVLGCVSADWTFACGSEDSLPHHHVETNVSPLVGHWTHGEILGAACNVGRSEIGFRVSDKDYALSLPFDFCIRLMQNQEKAQLEGITDLFTTRIFVWDEKTGIVGFESLRRMKKPLLWKKAPVGAKAVKNIEVLYWKSPR